MQRSPRKHCETQPRPPPSAGSVQIGGLFRLTGRRAVTKANPSPFGEVEVVPISWICCRFEKIVVNEARLDEKTSRH